MKYIHNVNFFICYLFLKFTIVPICADSSTNLLTCNPLIEGKKGVISFKKEGKCSFSSEKDLHSFFTTNFKDKGIRLVFKNPEKNFLESLYARELYAFITFREDNAEDIFRFLETYQKALYGVSLKFKTVQGVDWYQLKSFSFIQELDLSQCLLTDSDIKEVKEYFAHIPASLRVINLSKTGLTSEGLREILERFPVFNKLTELNLSYNNLDFQTSDLLSELSQKHFKHLKALNISTNALGGEKVEVLGQSLTKMSLVSLDLSYNQFTPESFSKFAPYVPQRIKELNFRGNKLGLLGTQMLVLYLPPQLETLNLSFTDLNDHSLVYLIPHLPKNLKKLSLGGNGLGEQGTQEIIAYLQKTPLKVLDLSCMHLPSNYSSLLMPAIHKLTESLESLDLSQNSLPPPLIKALHIHDFTKLRILRLNQTDLGDEGLAALLMNPLPPRLKHLELSCNAIQSEGALTLKQYFESEPSNLEILNLKHNRLRDQGVEILASSLPLNLKHLSLAENQLTEKGAQTVAAHFLTRISQCVEKQACRPVLECLDFSGNQIKSVGFSYLIESLPLSVRSLNVSFNEIESLPEKSLDFIQALETLQLSGNKLNDQKLRFFLTALPRSLKELHLMGNQINVTLFESWLEQLPHELEALNFYEDPVTKQQTEVPSLKLIGLKLYY